MTSGNSEKVSDLDKARSYLERAERWFSEDSDEAAALAAIGTGYAVLTQVEAGVSWPPRRVSEIPPALAAAVERVARAAEEARPHDGEPVPGPGCYPPADGWDGVSVVDDAKEADRG